MEFWRYYRAVRARLWLVALLAVVAMGAVGGFYLRQPPHYASTSRLLIRQQPGTTQVFVFPVPDSGAFRGDTTRSDLIQIILGPTVLKRVAARYPGGLIPGAITAVAVQGTSLLNITAQAATPAGAQRLAAAATEEFLRYYRELNGADAAEARRFLQGQLGQARTRLEQAEDRVAAFKQTHQLPAIDQQVNALVQSMVQMETERDQADVAVAAARARIGAIQRALGGQKAMRVSSQSLVDNPSLVQMRTRLTDLQLRLNELTQIYTDEHPQVIAVRQEIAALEQQLPAAAARVVGTEQVAVNPLHESLSGQLIDQTTEYTASLARRNALAGTIRSMESRLPNLSLAQRDLARLVRDQASAEQTYTLLSSKLNEAIIKEAQAGYETASVRIVDAAAVPTAPVSNGVPLKSALALILGGLLGVGATLFLDYLDSSVRTPEQAEALYGTPVLGIIPTMNRRVYRQLTTIRPAWATVSLVVVAVLVAALALVMFTMRSTVAGEAIKLWALISAI